MSIEPETIVAEVEAACATAYTEADPSALAALFAEDASVQTEWGPVLRNRDEIMDGLVALFASRHTPDELTNHPVLSHWVSEDVIVSHGTAERRSPGYWSEVFLYTRLYVLRDGAWLIAANQIARPSSHTKPQGIGSDEPSGPAVHS
jgi:uncharacterized protein (TIGR02246 family)